MTIHLAVNTLAAIEHMVNHDQGATFRGWLAHTMPKTSDAYDTNPDGRRSHLGASVIGRECAREIWYGFRWATKSNHSGRMLRLFNRGHLEEGRFIAMLLAIGCTVYQHDENGKQFRITHANMHMGGSGDGIAIGVPDVPANAACLSEFKTHNNKSFEKLKEEGVRLSKPEHYIQINIYLDKMKIDYCLYLAVNKDTDELYGEIIFADRKIAGIYLERGENIIASTNPPEPLSKSPGFWKCKYCDHRAVCHLNKVPEVSCRTCYYSTPIENALWYCSHNKTQLDKDAQKRACPSYSRLF